MAHTSAKADRIVIAGRGWAQREGGPVEEINPVDVILFSPNESIGTELPQQQR